MIRLLRRRDQDWAALQRRMLAETALYLEEGLRSRAWGARIPRIPVGRGSFSRVFSAHFWQQVLFESS